MSKYKFVGTVQDIGDNGFNYIEEIFAFTKTFIENGVNLGTIFISPDTNQRIVFRIETPKGKGKLDKYIQDLIDKGLVIKND